VVTHGSHHLVRNLLDSLKAHPDHSFLREVVVVDNGFPEMGDARLHLSAAAFPFPVRFAQHHGHSYSRSLNLGVANCEGPILLLSNNDVEWLPGFSIVPLIDEMMRHPDVGIAGPQLVFPDGRWQYSSGSFPSLLEGVGRLFMLGVLRNRLASARHQRGAEPGPAREVDYVDGACMAVSRTCFDDIGGFDSETDFYGGDTEFNWRARRAGWRRVTVPAARVMHIRGASSAAIARKDYAKRLFVAKKRLVQKISGPVRAAAYDFLQRVAALEYAIIYSVLDAFWPTAASRRRALSARAVALAALEGEDAGASGIASPTTSRVR
jgi:GT2 family glycosyltransferase